MVSLTLMARLLEAVRPQARLVLVGDPDQLASVEAGAVLKDLVDGLGPASPAVARLSTSHRFRGGRSPTSPRATRTPVTRTLPYQSCRPHSEVRLTHRDPQTVDPGHHACGSSKPRATRDRRTALATLDEHRLLCAHRSGPYGAGHWNRAGRAVDQDSTGSGLAPALVCRAAVPRDG